MTKRLGLALVLVLCLVAGIRQLARARTFQLFGHLVSEVELRDSLVALTFDDGPVEAVTDSLLATLRSRGIHATFFVTGRELAAAPLAGARITAEGHELGNHSWSHEHLDLAMPRRIRAEVERTDSVIRRAGERGAIFFRAPYGAKLVSLPWYLWRTHRTSVMWSIEPDSYADVAATAQGIVAHVMARVHPGSIILLHPWYRARRTSREAVGPLLDSLQASGYRVVTVRELLGARSASAPD